MPTKNGYIAAGVVAAGLLAAGGASVANAATGTDTGQNQGYTAPAEGSPGQGGPMGHDGPRHLGTRVTGDEATRVGDAVRAKDASATVDGVMKDPRGNYHVMATVNGKHVMFRVSKDLKTVTKDDHRGWGRHHRGRHMGSPVGKDVSQKVADVVKAKDSAVKVERVFKRTDGSYVAFGTKNGRHVMFRVDKDLKNATQQTLPDWGRGGPKHDPRHGGPDGGGGMGGPGQGAPKPAPSASGSPSA